MSFQRLNQSRRLSLGASYLYTKPFTVWDPATSPLLTICFQEHCDYQLLVYWKLPAKAKRKSAMQLLSRALHKTLQCQLSWHSITVISRLGLSWRHCFTTKTFSQLCRLRSTKSCDAMHSRHDITWWLMHVCVCVSVCAWYGTTLGVSDSYPWHGLWSGAAIADSGPSPRGEEGLKIIAFADHCLNIRLDRIWDCLHQTTQGHRYSSGIAILYSPSSSNPFAWFHFRNYTGTTRSVGHHL